ncbi:hypothetical protein K458DRAFT_77356 [Lentithecium fluviatile CBS 122367]|uniref:Uncharacterized protein n=1 Tax=Lentithecium fluviatile CBS 122367 TaxID=1168545 RepID=A0A6G1IU77_9PLEO|nr:hypothetical protein K458DRAFT_77356 [Lentithecium fluviatile CBS 122367]
MAASTPPWQAGALSISPSKQSLSPAAPSAHTRTSVSAHRLFASPVRSCTRRAAVAHRKNQMANEGAVCCSRP